MTTLTPLHQHRLQYKPTLPSHIQDLDQITIEDGPKTQSAVDQEELSQLFKNTYGLPMSKIIKGTNADIHREIRCGFILSGGPAAGGHNVVAGLFDGLKKGNPNNKLYGFRCGPGGILKNDYFEVTEELINQYRNTGGFDLVGSSRTKIETEEHFTTAFKNITELNLNVMVIVGGDDSNTNCAVLAEYFKEKGSECQFIGVPKTIDGDLKNEFIETSFGFHSACKTYAEIIGNIERDAISSRKYWHFVKVMGRAASNIALEVYLQTQPNISLISEEILEKKMTIQQIAEECAEIVIERSKKGLNFGVAVLPEGLVEFIPEMRILISELNDLVALKADEFAQLKTFEEQKQFVFKNLKEESVKTFNSLPDNIAKQLLLDRDPHGNVNVSAIETETLVSGVVKREIERRGLNIPFNPIHHFCGYEGRCCFPTNFDATYCYALGYTAFILGALKRNGTMCTINNLTKPADQWICGGCPITVMMNMEQRSGKKKPVIKKYLVELDGKVYNYYKNHRKEWIEDGHYLFPGAVQYFGPREVCDLPALSLLHEFEYN